MHPIIYFPSAYGAGKDRQAPPWALHPHSGPLALQVRLRPPIAVPLPYQFCIVRKACVSYSWLLHSLHWCQLVVRVVTSLLVVSRHHGHDDKFQKFRNATNEDWTPIDLYQHRS
ncbi:hypothetical protein CGRA01v4_04771 [Colletotrichum graminicola]|nr:hypothetical protein CGRA01v4_04771 [Colletotrichum graminicola]